MRSLLQRCALALAAVVALLGTRPATANAQKALVYCPVSVDATGCNAIVAALTGPAYPLGVDRGYDGTDGTVDLKAVDLFSYSVFVVPSLADDSTSQPYAKLRDPEVAEHLKAALIGRIAMWSGTPDQGATNRTMKDALIQNLAAWAGGAFATAKGPGLVALLDASAGVVSRYDWVRAITPVPVTSDPALLIYNNVRALNQRATTILTSGAGAIAYSNMATFGFQLPNGAPGVNLDAVGQTGTSQGGQVVLLTMEAGNSSGATVSTDKDDYAPGETVVISGTGWQAGETVKLTLHMDPLRDADTELSATADASGNFSNTDFAPGTYDVGVRFVLTAIGATSGSRAQTTFTDGPTDFGVSISPITATSGGSQSYLLRVWNASDNNNNVLGSANVTVPSGWTVTTPLATPTGAPNPRTWTASLVSGVIQLRSTANNQRLNRTNGSNPADTIKLVFTATAPSVAVATPYTWSTIARMANDFTGSPDWTQTSPNAVVTVSPATVATTTTVSNATATYGDASVTLNATVTPNTVNNGSVAFTVKQGASVIGVTTTDATVVAGAASVVYSLPTGTAAGGYTIEAVYTPGSGFSGSNGAGTLTIGQKSLTPSVTVANKVYDTNTSATILTRTLTGVVPGDAVSLTGGTANFVDKNVGTGKTVSVTGLTLSGTAAANYQLFSTSATTTANITALAISGSITANNKSYDGTTTATIATRTLSGVLGSDVVSYVGGTATFDNANVGTGKLVTATGLSLSGADAGNYTVNTSCTATADITTATVTGSFTAANKEYDGTTAAIITGRSLSGAVSGDAVSLTGGTATFANKNTGTAKTVTGTGFSLTGAAAGNYVLASTTLTTTADITAKALVGSFTANNKTYDGNNSATVAAYSLSGVIGSEVVAYSGGTATFDNKNVGMGKTVTLTGASLTGADAGNYTVNSTATSTANITALGVTGAFTAANKVYDGTANATVLTRSVVGAISGDAVSLTGGTAAFGDKNVGTGKTVTLTGAALSGTDAANYTLGLVATATADITVKTLTVSATGVNKVYDGTTAATVTLSDDRLGGDVVTTSYTTAAFANKNVGTGKTVTVSGISITGGADANNYTLAATTTSTTANITALGITGSFTVSSKVYDGNTSASILTRSLSGTIAGDAISLDGGTATFDTKNVGTGKTVTGTGFTLGGGDAGNYTLTSVATTTANITALAITGSITAANKVYDGTTAATIVNRTLAGVVSGDDVNYVGGTATFGDKNVGSGKTVSATGLNLSGGDAGNYTVNSTATTTADITPRTLTVTAHGVNKVYDGTTAATATFSDDRVSGDGLTVTYSGAAFAGKNVGAAKTVTVTGIAISGSDAGNYNVAATSATTTADITALGITGHITADNKVYDGTTAATILTRTLTGSISGDIVSYVGGTATFDDKNAGMGKTVTATGLSLTGSDAGNYTVNPTATTTANITPLGITGNFTASSKVYDATTNATVLTRTLTGVLGSDDVTLTAGTAAFGNKNVGTAKTVTLTGATLSGGDAGNYSLTSVNTTTADITALAITGSITAANKVYDGTTAATILTRSLSGVIGGDAVTYVGGSANFDTKDIGTGKTVTATGLGLSSADAGNYTVNTTATNTADITAKALTGSITAANKTYDGNTSATILTRALSGVIGSEVVNYVGGTATFGDKNVGTGKTVTATGLSLAGADAGNYTVNSTATTTANITPLGITGNFTADNKIYDGNTSAAVLTRTLNGVIGLDAVSLSGGTATFDTKNVGTSKTVTLAGATLSGGDADNYSLTSVATTTADITPLGITGHITADSKVYDGTTTATIATRTLTGQVSGDNVSYVGGTATFDTKNIGTGKTVTAAGLSLSGADAGNYTVNTTATNTADITAKALIGSITAANKVYDGNTSASILTRTLSGVISGETVTYVGGSATFDTKNVGMGKTVTATGLSLSGADAGNYTVNGTATATANITPLGITGSVTAANKVYDGTTAAAILTRTLAGVIGTDAVSYTGGTATFNNKNVGSGKPVTGAGLGLSGADAGNYTVNSTAVTVANITQATPTINWANPANIVWPAPLTGTQLNATVSGVLSESPSGSFGYTPPSGTVLTPGTSTLSVLFTSGDLNYTNATASVSITVLDQTKPLVSNSMANPNPAPLGTASIALSATISDATTGGSKIMSACYRIDGGACTAVNTFTPQVTVNVSANIPIPNATDVIEACLYGTDAGGNTNVQMDCVLIAIYDPNGGFVTGGGWVDSPAGAYLPAPSLTGKATFGFVSKYKKGQSAPDGNTEFQFHAGGMNFKSSVYEWLVVSGAKAQFKGTGTINGSGNYGFMLTAIDGQLNGGGGTDKFRIKIWDKNNNDKVVYDNQILSSDTADPTTLLGGGSINIQAK